MSVLGILLLIAIFCFLGYQIYGLVKQIKARKKSKEVQKNDCVKSDKEDIKNGGTSNGDN